MTKMKCSLENEALERILVWPYNRRIAILSNYEYAKQIFQAFLISKISKCTSENIYLIDYSGKFRSELLSNIVGHEKLENIVYLEKLIDGIRGCSLHIHNPSESNVRIGSIIRNVDVEFIIITDYSPSKALKGTKGFLKVYCRKRKDRIYELKTFTDKVLIAVSKGNIIEAFKILPKYLFRALSLLKEAAVEYGNYTVKDAVVIVSARMNVNKNFARKIISDLVSYGFIEVNKGYVIV